MEKIQQLIHSHFGQKAPDVTPLPRSGSDRQYYRFNINGNSFLAAINPNVKENLAFFEMSRHFKKQGILVPELFAVSEDKTTYILQDLGDLNLFQHLTENRHGDDIHPATLDYYKDALRQLAHMQTTAAASYNFNYTWPAKAFSKQAILWDLNYFKYYFARIAGVPFDEYALEKDFHALADFLMKAPSGYFMYRDFQSRNIMIHNDQVWFIDYQGGRKGALQYDVASLLWQARAKLPGKTKNALLKSYLKGLSKHISVDETEFRYYYNAFVLIRVLQTLGAYGFRGLYQQKQHFLISLPYAFDNLADIRRDFALTDNYPELAAVIDRLLSDEYRIVSHDNMEKNQLRVLVQSFSYKNGIPKDMSGHGGGHVFDCRAVHNPGRYEDYKQLTGKDEPVRKFLDKTAGMQEFLRHVKYIVGQSVEVYQKREFGYLSVSFGCTGGQHRSVYAAEKMASFLNNKCNNIDLVIQHRELEKMGTSQ
ncbi:MAG: RapZ C-terminal domain-containing protein [Bacteroidota bacterium]